MVNEFDMNTTTPPKIIKFILIFQLSSMLLVAGSTYFLNPMLLALSISVGSLFLILAIILYGKVFIKEIRSAMKKIDS